jgi:hypothetical protein
MATSYTTETSYARVFRQELPARGARYVMVFMLNNTTNHRDIHWGWSADGRTWTYDQRPLVRHSDVGAVNIGGARTFSPATTAPTSSTTRTRRAAATS